jgi:hypothetical protein
MPAEDRDRARARRPDPELDDAVAEWGRAEHAHPFRAGQVRKRE